MGLSANYNKNSNSKMKIALLTLLVVASASAKLEIINRNSEKIVKIQLGRAKLSNGFFNIIHNTNLLDLKTLTTRLEATSEKLLQDHLVTKEIIKRRCNEITKSLLLLAPTTRQRRAIAWIGSAWKWVAGNPDQHDFEVMESHVNDIIDNNNKQVKINNEFQNKINTLTAKYLDWQSGKSTEDDMKLYLVEELNQIQRTIDNIFATIHLAKTNVVNQALLDEETIRQVKIWADTNDLTSLAQAQTLDFAKISVAITKDKLISIMSFPTLEKGNYEYSIIKAVTHGKLTINLKTNRIVTNETHTFAAQNPCIKVNGIFVCQENNLTDLEGDECVPNILKQANATCDFFNTHTSNEITEIEDGILLLNNYNGTITSSCAEPTMIKGTFIIKISNCTIQLGNRIYHNQDKVVALVEDSKFHRSPALGKIDNKLSLEYLEDLHINNTKQIRRLESANIWLPSTHISLSSICIIAAVIAIIWTTRAHTTQATPAVPQPQPAPTATQHTQVFMPAPAYFTYKQRGRALD